MKYLLTILSIFILFSCSEDKIDKKGFPISEANSEAEEVVIDSLSGDTLSFKTQARGVLLTNDAVHRLTPIYKINYHKKTKKPFTGSNRFHSNYWNYGDKKGNNWHNNFMPGFEAVYGYNFVNVSHFNNKTREENTFFDKAVLIKTLYYPAFTQDTLNGDAVKRKFYMVSVYDEDTNKDGFINVKDLRRFYHFDIEGNLIAALVPENYSVMSSEYDPANDFMYIFAKLDENENGQMEYEEATHVFWIDLKNPENRGAQYTDD